VGKEPTGPGLTPDEAAYYRAVEDHFARLRGTVFVISPKDYALLRGWWRDGVPLAAVLAGVAEVFERRERGSADPVSSLTYCRHAVSRHARRLVGASGARLASPLDASGALTLLSAAIRRAAESCVDRPPLAAVLDDLRQAVESLPAEADPVALEETLARLELAALESAATRLPDGARAEIDARVASELANLTAGETVRSRTERALRLRLVRELLGLPRLELGAGGRG
jgi:hypothetical protein